MSYQMKMNKQKFMKTEFGIEMEKVIRKWDAALETPGRDTKPEVLRELAWCQAQWEVYKLALKQFYGKEYFFSRTDDYFGICTEDESDYLMRVDREPVQAMKLAPESSTDILELAEKTSQRIQEYLSEANT